MASAARSSPTQKKINKMTSEQLGKYLEQPTPLENDETIRKLEKEMNENDAREKALNNPAMQSALLLLKLNLTNERLSDIRERLIRIGELKQKLQLSKRTPKEKQAINKILDTEKNQLEEERNKLRESLARASASATASAQARPAAAAARGNGTDYTAIPIDVPSEDPSVGMSLQVRSEAHWYVTQ